MSKKLLLSEEILKYKYIIEKKSMNQVAKELHCSLISIFRYLQKYNIKTRSAGGANNLKYKCIKYSKHHYCKSCDREICQRNFLYGQGRCNHCAKRNNLNPNYIDGRNSEKYSPEFTQSLREQIRKRDDYKCQHCGMTQEEHFTIYGRDIEVHHIDYNKQNCKKKNLITLCKQCNIRANYNRKYWEIHYNKIIVLKFKLV